MLKKILNMFTAQDLMTIQATMEVPHAASLDRPTTKLFALVTKLWEPPVSVKPLLTPTLLAILLLHSASLFMTIVHIPPIIGQYISSTQAFMH